MSMPYQLVVFDWEGTLGDPLGHIHEVLKTESEALGLGPYDVQRARRYVALGLDKAVRKIFPDLALYQYERLLAGVQQALVSNHGAVYLFPGVKHLLQQLRHAGIDMAIATNRGSQALQRALHVSELEIYFPVTRSADQAPAKPCPQMLEEILELTGVSADQTLMIGDAISDIEMASALDVASIGVDFYYQQGDDLKVAGALQVFDDFATLGDYLGLPA
jgi:phosphoglycolate phosphatase|tara:strand:- start:116587 stop:117243 length:657 start_codon:yes stop_codon:yes gene_type:complete